MSITTVYKCDRCGKEADNPHDYYHVGVLLNSVYMATGRWSASHQQQWCTSCCEKVGIRGSLARFHKENEPKEAPPPAPTLEDMVRALIREELDNQ